MDDQETIRYERIPEPIRDVFRELEDELIQLCFRWKLYCQLYRKSELRIELLNATAPELFHHLQFIQLNDVLLGICRLTDPVKSGSNDNLVLRQLLRLDSNTLNAEVGAQLSCELDAADELASHFRTIRHKKIAHLDLNAALSADKSPIAGVKYVDVDLALKAIRKAMNTFRIAFTDCEMGYEHLHTLSDANTLVAALTRSVVFGELQDADWTLRDRLRLCKYWEA